MTSPPQQTDRWSGYGEDTGIRRIWKDLDPETLRRFPLFREFKDSFLQEISPDVSVAEWNGRSVLFEEGSYLDLAFYVVEGTVELALEKLEGSATPIFTTAGAPEPRTTKPISPAPSSGSTDTIAFLATMDFDLGAGRAGDPRGRGVLRRNRRPERMAPVRHRDDGLDLHAGADPAASAQEAEAEVQGPAPEPRRGLPARERWTGSSRPRPSSPPATRRSCVRWHRRWPSSPSNRERRSPPRGSGPTPSTSSAPASSSSPRRWTEATWWSPTPARAERWAKWSSWWRA